MRPFDFITANVAQGSYPEPLNDIFHHVDVLVLCAEELQARTAKAPPGKLIVRLGYDDDFYRPIPAEAGQIFHAHAKSLARHALAGRKVLVTCAMGLNRSGLMTALTLMHGYKMSAANAIKLIRGRRSPDCLSNPMFERWLLSQE